MAGPASPTDEARARADGFYRQANTLLRQGGLEQAVAAYDQALAASPDHVDARFNRGTALHELGRHEAAVSDFNQVLATQPDDAEALFNRANALQALKRYDAALADYDRALAADPAFADALANRAASLLALKRYADALGSAERALAFHPDHVDALVNRGSALWELKRYEEALAGFDQALALAPDYAEALYNRGNVLHILKRYAEALESYERALTVNPQQNHAVSGAADCVLKLCDWVRRPRYRDLLIDHVRYGKSIVAPFTLLGYVDDPALQFTCATAFLHDKIPEPPPPLWTGPAKVRDKVRLAYLSADFRDHPCGYLTENLFPYHDKSRFELIGISFGADDASETRRRLVSLFDQFHDVQAMGDEDAARLLLQLGVDIAVDMMGYTQDARTGILALRPAPVQVSWLGFPATTGAQFIDYIMGEAGSTPFDEQAWFAERIVQMPEAILVRDGTRVIHDRGMTREGQGLPSDAVVFCGFNGAWKIAPQMFDVWMRLLAGAPGSVLWLLDSGKAVNAALRRQAEARGVDPDRIVFAPWVEAREDALARYKLADLFLDTVPYNAHATAADAMLAGLPVLTVFGGAFAARKAAGLVRAAGMGDLVAADLAGYEARARELASDRAALAALKERLGANRGVWPLLDAARYARHLESAYETMMERARRGEPPAAFAVPPMSRGPFQAVSVRAE